MEHTTRFQHVAPDGIVQTIDTTARDVFWNAHTHPFDPGRLAGRNVWGSRGPLQRCRGVEFRAAGSMSLPKRPSGK